MRRPKRNSSSPCCSFAPSGFPRDRTGLYELKLDGYRALAIKSYGVAHLRSRNNKSFDGKYPAIVKALARLPDETVIDGEVVALDESGRPSFSSLQNSPSGAPLCYYVFDVIVLAGRNVMSGAAVRQTRAAARPGRASPH